MITAAAVVGWLVAGLAAGRVARWAADRDRDRIARRTAGPGLTTGQTNAGPGAAIGSTAWDGAGIEAVCAVVLVALAAQLGWGRAALPYVGLVATLAAVTITDLRHYRVPDRILAAGLASTALAMAVVTATATATGSAGSGHPGRAALGAALFAGPLLAVHLAVPRGLGRGDVKLSLLLGAGIGWIGPPGLGTVLLVVWALIVACALGLAAALVLRVTTPAHPPAAAHPPNPADRRPAWVPSGSIPFAPALSIATVGVVIAAGPLLR